MLIFILFFYLHSITDITNITDTQLNFVNTFDDDINDEDKNTI